MNETPRTAIRSARAGSGPDAGGSPAPAFSGCRAPASAQRGIAVVTAVFMLLLFAALAALMANLVSTSQTTSTQDMLGARAYEVAQGGVEWGLFQLDPASANAAPPDCFASTTLNQFPGFAVTVGCEVWPPAAQPPYDEAGRDIRIYRITATARAAAQPLVVERQASATIEKCRDPSITAAPYFC